MTSFCVHAPDDPVARPHRVKAGDAVEAALAYVERWRPAAGPGPLVVHVENEESGEERCLSLDLDHGEVAPCS